MKTKIILLSVIAFTCFGFARPGHKDITKDGVMHPSDKQKRARERGDRKDVFKERINVLCAGPAASLPYSIGKDEKPVNLNTKQQDIAREMQSYILQGDAKKGSRSNEFKFVERLEISPVFRSFIFSETIIMRNGSFPPHYILVNTDTNGYILSSMYVAISSPAGDRYTANITADGTIENINLIAMWEKDPKEAGYTNNRIKEYISIKDYNYKITADGDIVKLRP